MSPRHWTDETDREAASFFATLSDREIRRRQDLCAEQIAMAHEQHERHGRDMTDALWDLRCMEEALTQAMLVRLTPLPVPD